MKSKPVVVKLTEANHIATAIKLLRYIADTQPRLRAACENARNSLIVFQHDRAAEPAKK